VGPGDLLLLGAIPRERWWTTGRLRGWEKTSIGGTAADPSLPVGSARIRWGLNVEIEDISEKVAGASVARTHGRGDCCHGGWPTQILRGLKYFRVTHGKIAGVPVDISRTGLQRETWVYEIWVPCKDAIKVFDALMDKGRAFRYSSGGDGGAWTNRADRRRD